MGATSRDGMHFEEIFRITAAIIGEALRINPETITPESNLLIDLNAESIDLVDIRFRIEERFGFKVEQRTFIQSITGGAIVDIQEHLTVRGLVDFIVSELGAKEEKR